eukprot:COSAG02_NODE_288_length_25612_cov_29.808529_16_plen_272_part_00
MITLDLCFFETGVIGGVSSVFSVFFESAGEPRSSAARLDGGGSLSFSRLCSFFGSWSRRTFSRLNRRAHPKIRKGAKALFSKAKRNKRLVKAKEVAGFVGLVQSCYLAIPVAQLLCRELNFDLADKESWSGSVRLPRWSGEVLWINCDWDQLDLVAQRLEAEPTAVATVLCPYFPGQLAFARLQRLAADILVMPWDHKWAVRPGQLGSAQVGPSVWQVAFNMARLPPPHTRRIKSTAMPVSLSYLSRTQAHELHAPEYTYSTYSRCITRYR